MSSSDKKVWQDKVEILRKDHQKAMKEWESSSNKRKSEPESGKTNKKSKK